MNPDTHRYVVVEVHDVCASRLRSAKAILHQLDVVGARPRVLLVIPAEISTPDGELVDLLRRELAAGSEIVLHGFDHQATGRFHGRPHDVLRARWFAPRDAEFLELDQREARRRLEEGRSRLAACGLSVPGFCAPGWLEPAWLPALLGELGFDYDIGMSVLRDLRRGASRRLPWVGEVGVGGVHGALVALGGSASRLGRVDAPLKVFFHARPEVASADRRVLTILERELHARRAVCYSSILAS